MTIWHRLQFRKSFGEIMVQQSPIVVCLSRGTVETVGSPQDGLHPWTVVVRADGSDFGDVDTREKIAQSRDEPY